MKEHAIPFEGKEDFSVLQMGVGGHSYTFKMPTYKNKVSS